MTFLFLFFRESIMPKLNHLLCLFILTLAGALHAEPSRIDAFLNQHCFECHDEDVQKGDLDLASMTFEPQNHDNAKVWEKVYKVI